jgi:hypothetical protein
VGKVPVGITGRGDALVHLVDDHGVPGDRLRCELGEHRPRGVPPADRDVEAATGADRGTGTLGHERRPGPGHGAGVGQGFEFMVHAAYAFFSA